MVTTGRLHTRHLLRSVPSQGVEFWGWLGDRAAASQRLGLAETESPAEFLRETLAQFGVAGLEDLVGEFAARIQTPTETLLVRDHLGIYPLYYGWDEDDQLIANPNLAIVRDRSVNGGVDEAAVAREMAWVLLGPKDETTFTGIHRVPPGHVTAVRGRADTRHVRYFHPEAVPARTLDFDAAELELEAVLHAAVSDAKGGSTRIGTHLSGGLDSGLVAGIAARQLQPAEGLQLGVSWCPDQALDHSAAEPTEVRMARLTAQALAVPLQHVNFAEVADSWIMKADPLIYRPWQAVFYEALCAPEFRRARLDVVLSGWGGDEVASKNAAPPWAWLLRNRKYAEALRGLRSRDTKTGRPGWSAAARQLIPPKVKARRRDKAAWIRPGAVEWAESHPEVLAQIVAQRAEGRTVREQQIARMQRGHLSRRAEAWWQIGHDFGYEYRYPLLDQRVVRWALSMSPNHFWSEGVGRRTFRAVARKYLPEAVAAHASKAEPARAARMVAHPTALVTTVTDYYPELREIATINDRCNASSFAQIRQSIGSCG